MPTFSLLRVPSSRKRLGDTWFLGVSKNYLAPTSQRLILCSGTLTVSSTIETILAAELTENYGYTRQLLAWTDATNTGDTYTWTHPAINVPATGLSLNYNTAVVLSNAHANANKAVTLMTASTDLITVNNHGLTVDDKVLFTGTGSVSSGITQNTIYFVQAVPDSNTFKISATSGGSAIDLSTDSSGALTLRYANGWVEFLYAFSSPQTILDGTSEPFITAYSLATGT